MKSFKILALIALVVSLGTVNAKAMGEREKGALLGLVGGIVIYNLIENNNARSYNEPRYETKRYTRHVYKPNIRNERHNNERIIIINRVSDKVRYYDRKRDRRDEYRRR